MSEIEQAARRRAAHLVALRTERDGYLRACRPERAAEVDAEIARTEGRPVGRSESEQPAPATPRRTRARKS